MNEDVTAMQDALLEQIKAVVSDGNKELKAAVEAQGLELQRLKGGGGVRSVTPLGDILKTKAKEFEALLAGAATAVKVLVSRDVIKALASTGSVNDSTQGITIPGVGQIATPTISLRNLFRSVTIGTNSGGRVKYLDQDQVTRGAATRSEGNAAGESSIEWVEKSLEIRAITDHIPVTKELMTDYVQLGADVEKFLTTNVSLKTEDQLWDGDNNAPNLAGMYTIAEAYLNDYSGPAIDAPNIYDLLVVLRAQMIANKGGKYQPNFVALSPEDFAAVRLVKNAVEQYALPGLANTSVIAGMQVVESSQVVSGTLLLGDSLFGTIYQINDSIELTFGLMGDQLKERKMTVLAEDRLNLLIRNVDADGFMKVTDIDAALAALASPGS